MRILPAILGGLVLCLAQVAMATPVNGLYRIVEPLEDDSEQAMQQAMQQSFVSLIQRLTGDAKLVQRAELAVHAENPVTLASGYNYQNGHLQIEFDQAAVTGLLRDAGIALWGSDRPQSLVWWKQDGLQGLHLLGDGQTRAQQLTQVAMHRGLPLRFPLADLSEQVSGDEGLEAVYVSELMQRYATETLLEVSVVPLTTGALRANWRLHGLAEPLSGRTEGDTLEALGDALFSRLARNMAGRYAVVPGQGVNLEVRIKQPDSGSLQAAERILKAFGGRLLRLSPGEAVWTVTALPEQLRSQMQLQQFVEQYADEEAPVDGQVLVFFRS